MPAPAVPPIGLQLSAAAKLVSRAFDDALGAAGGSISTWLILLSIKRGAHSNQRDLADAIGITGATLTHHLNSMETNGLLVRQRNPDNRRIHRVELTDAGEAAFQRLRQAAARFDQQLRSGLGEKDLAELTRLLGDLSANVTSGGNSSPQASPA